MPAPRAEELRAERISPFAGTGMEGGTCLSVGSGLVTPKDLRDLLTPFLQPTSRWAAGFAEGHRLLPWDVLGAVSPAAQGFLGGRRGPTGDRGTRAILGAANPRFPPAQCFQSLTLTHPSAERIHMSARLINTSDFNLRSHGDRFILPASSSSESNFAFK